MRGIGDVLSPVSGHSISYVIRKDFWRAFCGDCPWDETGTTPPNSDPWGDTPWRTVAELHDLNCDTPS